MVTGRPLVFDGRVNKTSNGCWQWTGLLTKAGYGAMFARGEHGAHRVSWLLHRGPIPTGLQLDHLCRNRACVNPDHMEPVTVRENVLRGEGPAARHARQTTCLHGHLFDEANTYPYRGGRRCRQCGRDAAAKKRAAIREGLDRW